MFPASLDELITAGHLCRVIDAFVARLDPGQLGFARTSAAATDRPPYDPADLPVNRSMNNHGDGQYFDRRAFNYAPETDGYRGPAGQWPLRKQLHRTDRTVTYAAPLENCAGSAMKARCAGAARVVARHLHDEALQNVAARTTAVLMRPRRETAEDEFAELRWRIFGYAWFLLRGRCGAGTEMAIGVIAYNPKQALRALRPAGLIAALAS